MGLLLDSSAWIDYLRNSPTRACKEVDRLLREKTSVMTTEPIVMELLAGAPTDRALSQLEMLTGGLPLIQVDNRLDYNDAAAIYRTTRKGWEPDTPERGRDAAY